MDTSLSTTLPAPKDLSHHLSKSTAARKPSPIKAFYKYFLIPGIGQLAGGLPNHNYFPFDTLEASTALPNRFEPTPNNPVKPIPPTAQPSKTHSDIQARVLVPKDSKVTDRTREIDVKTALQYGQAMGYPPLFNWIKAFTTQILHPNIPYAGGVDIVMTNGSTDGFSKVVQTFLNEWYEGETPVTKREGLLVEEFAYMTALQTAEAKAVNIVPVAMDTEGMAVEGPGALKDVLENWDKSKGKVPHVMYTVTTGQNPTGRTLSLKRRKEIYSLCQKFDIIIAEDDPYWYLQYPSAGKANASSGKIPSPLADDLQEQNKSSGYAFIDSLVPSYLSIDIDGRVVRLDTFSKTAAPGCRLGWITAQPALIDRMLRITETNTAQPSGFVQSMVCEMVMGPQSSTDPGRGGQPDGNGWRFDGWVRWLEGLRGNYERRMNVICRQLEAGKYLVKNGRRNSISEEWSVIEKTQMYDFIWPMGGMFLWLEILIENHPVYKKNGSLDCTQISHALWLFLTTKPYLVLLAPASIFGSTPQITKDKSWRYFRICFAAIDMAEMVPISQRVSAGIEAFWKIKDSKAIQKILDDENNNDAVATAAEGLANMSMYMSSY